MAKQYRKPTNEVTVIYGGRSPAGRDTLNPKDVLPNGMTAKQHCEKLIAERGGKGHFIEKNSELEDVCCTVAAILADAMKLPNTATITHFAPKLNLPPHSMAKQQQPKNWQP